RLLFINTVHTDLLALSLHDALPILGTAIRGISYRCGISGKPGCTDLYIACWGRNRQGTQVCSRTDRKGKSLVTRFAYITVYVPGDRKSTRLNSSHVKTSYAVFCLKK